MGTERAQGFVKGPYPGTYDYGLPPATELEPNQLAYSGIWNVNGQGGEAVSKAAINLHFEAKNVYIVLSSQGERPEQVHVLLDGRPISAAEAGGDVHNGVVTVRRSRLYSIVALPGDQSHELQVRFQDGVVAYDFPDG